MFCRPDPCGHPAGWCDQPRRRDFANIPKLRTAISLNFIGATILASTVTGIFSYDISDPAKPILLGALQVIDVANPRLMRQLPMTLLPGGHTTTCVDGCN